MEQKLQEIQEKLECSICMDEYDKQQRRPMQLDCGHTKICQRCLDMIYKQNKITCPVCKQLTIKPKSDIRVNYGYEDSLDFIRKQRDNLFQAQIFNEIYSKQDISQLQQKYQQLCQTKIIWEKLLKKNNIHTNNQQNKIMEALRKDIDKMCQEQIQKNQQQYDKDQNELKQNEENLRKNIESQMNLLSGHTFNEQFKSDLFQQCQNSLNEYETLITKYQLVKIDLKQEYEKQISQLLENIIEVQIQQKFIQLESYQKTEPQIQQKPIQTQNYEQLASQQNLQMSMSMYIQNPQNINTRLSQQNINDFIPQVQKEIIPQYSQQLLSPELSQKSNISYKSQKITNWADDSSSISLDSVASVEFDQSKYQKISNRQQIIKYDNQVLIGSNTNLLKAKNYCSKLFGSNNFETIFISVDSKNIQKAEAIVRELSSVRQLYSKSQYEDIEVINRWEPLDPQDPVIEIPHKFKRLKLYLSIKPFDNEEINPEMVGRRCQQFRARRGGYDRRRGGSYRREGGRRRNFNRFNRGNIVQRGPAQYAGQRRESQDYQSDSSSEDW